MRAKILKKSDSRALSCKKIDNQHMKGIKGIEEVFEEWGLDETSFAVIKRCQHQRQKDHRLHWKQYGRNDAL